MINDFWNLIVETWQTGIRGVGIDDILICLAVIIGCLLYTSPSPRDRG